MARQRTIEILNTADNRALALRPIAHKLDISKSLSLDAYVAKSNALRAKLAAYNNLHAQIDSLRTELDDLGEELADFSSRLLKAIQAQFGTDSEEYAIAGGVRTRDRRRATRRDNEGEEVASAPPATQS